MENTYTVSEAAELIGVSVKTLQRWDREGKLVASRTPSNRRFYTEKQLGEILNVEKNKMREKFVVIAEKFIEYLKNGNFNEAFRFEMNDGVCEDNFGFATILVGEFDTWLFVTSMYGDGSGVTNSILFFEELSMERNWDDYLDMITDYYFENYKDFIPVF